MAPVEEAPAPDASSSGAKKQPPTLTKQVQEHDKGHPGDDDDDTMLSIVRIALMVSVAVVCGVARRTGLQSWAYVYGFVVTILVIASTFLRGFLYDSKKPSNIAEPAKEEAAPGSGDRPVVEAAAEDERVREARIAAEVKARVEERRLSQKRSSSPQKKSAGSEDPVWNTDWSNMEEIRQVKKPEVKVPVEVYEINDTSTWLARLQQRREQAERAGKKRLVQKYDKEIAEAQKSQTTAQTTSAAGPQAGQASKACAPEPTVQTQTPNSDSGAGDDDVWNMDWAQFAYERKHHAPTVAAA